MASWLQQAVALAIFGWISMLFSQKLSLLRRRRPLQRVPDEHQVDDQHRAGSASAEQPEITEEDQAPRHEANHTALGYGGLSQQPPLIPQDLSGKTFRLRGIPKKWDTAKVQRRLQEDFSFGPGAEARVRSLSTSPYNSNERVATVEFSGTLPGFLKDSGKTEWHLSIGEPDLVLDTHFIGMTPLHEADDPSCDIDTIALSGLNGHAFGSFKSKTKELTYMWLRDSLPTDFPRSRIFIYGYDTQMIDSNSFQNITDLSQRLKHDILLVRNSSESPTKRRLILIGHSLGGILIKAAINNMSESAESDRESANSILSILLFGVPNQGMDIQSLIPMVGDRPNRALLQSLGKESEVLQSLSKSFQNNLNPDHSTIFSFYETMESPTAKQVEGRWCMLGPPTVLVDRRSATNRRHWEQGGDFLYPVDRTHSEMVKFSSKHDPVYAVSLGFMKRSQENARVKFGPLSEEEQECLKSLSFPEQNSRQDQIHIASETCDWLLQHPSYNSWINEYSGLLWIKGKPGAGKSVLMKYTLQSLEAKAPQDGPLFAAFFVHGQGSQLQKSKAGLLRAILHQLLAQMPSLFSVLLPTYIERTHTIRDWQWEVGELQVFLQKCLESVCSERPVTLLVDALDELGEDVASEVVDYFQSLLPASPERRIPSLRICFSCRHYPSISLDVGHHVCVDQQNAKDIRYVVGNTLSGVADYDALLSLIVSRANGVFQWAVLISSQARALSGHKMMPAHIHSKIGELPKTLHQLYAELLRGSPLLTIRLFQWLCFSTIPMNPLQLRHMLAIDSGKPRSSLQEYEEDLGFEGSPDGLLSMVKLLSRGLAEITSPTNSNDGPTPYVSLIHQSVKDYLMQDGFQQIDPSLSTNLTGISNACLLEVWLKVFKTQELRGLVAKGTAKDVLWRKWGLNPAERYHQVFEGWEAYAQRADSNGHVPAFWFDHVDVLVELQGDNRVTIPENWPRGHDTLDATGLSLQTCSDHPPFKTFVHLLAYHGLKLSLKFLKDKGYSLSQKDGNGRTPLHIAAISDELPTVEFLLASGDADVNDKDKRGRTALSYAARRRSSAVVKSLLASGADVNDKDEKGRTALIYAAGLGFSAVVVKSLLASGADVNDRDKRGRTALSYAARRGSSAVVKSLLASGADVNDKDEEGPPSHTPLKVDS